MAMTPRFQRAPLRFRKFAAALTVSMLVSLGDTAIAEPQTNAASPKLWLEATFEPAAPYVQSQGVYTLRLYQAISVRDLQFHAPEAPLADIRLIGADRINEATRDGRRYRITERRYAVFPIASGELTLSGAHVTGLAALPGSTQALRVAAPAMPFAVLPIPPEAGTTTWLPARTLTLTETWAPDPSEARTGEALRRTIRIEARGLDAAQLPALAPGSTGFSAHPEAPRLTNRFDDVWNVGTREQTWLIVPTRPGPLTLPALQLQWWDPLAHQLRTASLPARTLTVATTLAADGSVAQPQSSASRSGGAAMAKPQPGPPAQAGGNTMARTALSLLILATTLTLSGCLLFAWHRRTAAWRALRTACRHNDPHTAHRALLHWATTSGSVSPPLTLGGLARHTRDPATRAALADLDRHLYGPSPGAWNGSALLNCLARKHPPSRGNKTGTLPTLYPE